MGFRCECKHLHSLVKVLRWRGVEDPEYLVETPEVQQATVFRKGLNRTSVEDALHADRLRGCRCALCS